MKKILAVILAIALLSGVAVMLTSCGSDAPETTTAATEEATEATTEATEAATEEATEATTEEAAEATTEETAEETTTEEAKKAPEGKKEIIEYFNTAVNKVKTDAKSVDHHYSKISLAGPTTLPSSLNTILKLLGGADEFLGDQLAKNSKGAETFNGSAAIKGGYPVEGETWASKLTEADVKSATCTEADGKYTITIVTVADSKSANVTHGNGHAPKAFNAVLPGVVNDNIPSVATGIVGTATMDYPSSTAKIVVDAETGKVLTANYDLYWTINFDKAGAILPFLTSDSYTINY